jgi:hypothetical protein
LPSRRQRDVEEARGTVRVVVEELVEIAHPIEDELVRMLRLRAEVLLHHRGVTGGRCRAGIDGPAHPAIIGCVMCPRVAPGPALRHNASIPAPMPTLELAPAGLSLTGLRRIWSQPVTLAIDAAAKPRVDAAAQVVDRIVASGKTVYGVNTGFGLLARTRIDDARLAELQRALVLSHSAGTGPPLDADVVRLIVALRRLRSRAGIRACAGRVIEALLDLVNAGHHAVHSGARIGRSVRRSAPARASFRRR